MVVVDLDGDIVASVHLNLHPIQQVTSTSSGSSGCRWNCSHTFQVCNGIRNVGSPIPCVRQPWQMNRWPDTRGRFALIGGEEIKSSLGKYWEISSGIVEESWRIPIGKTSIQQLSSDDRRCSGHCCNGDVVGTRE